MTAARDFWSRRRAAVAEESQAGAAAALDKSDAETRARLESMTDAEALEALNLPDPDDLGPGDDFAAFMMRHVPERIRRRALRALWRTNPMLANVDGLVDYGGDFTDSATVVENLQTAYRIGKGMLSHLEKLAADAEGAAVQAEAAPDEILPEHTHSNGALNDGPEDEDGMEIASSEYQEHATDDAEEVGTSPAPRRMVFVFDGDLT